MTAPQARERSEHLEVRQLFRSKWVPAKVNISPPIFRVFRMSGWSGEEAYRLKFHAISN